MHGGGEHPNHCQHPHKHCCKTGKGAHDKACCTSVCQVPGCQADLTTEDKAYCLHRHICKEHMHADDIYCSSTGQHLRFCSQCGKLEPLSYFDGNKRSCRVMLQKRKERRRHSSGSEITTIKAAVTQDRSHSHSFSSSACMLQADTIMAGEDAPALAASAPLHYCAPVSCSAQLQPEQQQELLRLLDDIDMSDDAPACQDPAARPSSSCSSRCNH